MAEEQQASFNIQRIYVKDASLEVPHAPEVFLQEWKPEFNVEMDNTVNTIDDSGVYDVQLKVTVTATQEDKTVYIAEIVQSGIFVVAGFAEEDRARLLGTVCPDSLYPYARQCIYDLIIKASFPPFLLSPVNFDYLYTRRMQNQQSSGNGADSE